MAKNGNRTSPGFYAQVDQDVWHAFADEQEIVNTSVSEYYLGRPPQTIADKEKICSELFRDFVAVGAVVLPDGRAVGDYAFTVRVDTDLNTDRNPVESLYAFDVIDNREWKFATDVAANLCEEMMWGSAIARLLVSMRTLRG